ncbi:MAG: MarR family winged helix-turn-helix transcriptional regulator [Planctomycetes bacterium]|nr:MarR family winged helix-turn-helix transcriptional regulator [Planctomycetota bacterium]MCH9793079.1 MarR family winged helix-turn-helix transcriptional regulator [Planctomycetota bacterium]
MMTNSKIDDLTNTIASECIAVRLRIVNRVVSKIYDDAFRPLGAKISQMNILVAVGKMGIARPADVCQVLHLDVSTLSRNVERMKARGWLEVIPDEDGRAQPIRLTSTGKKLIEQAAPAWEMAQKQSQELLGAAISGQLNQALKRINESAS